MKLRIPPGTSDLKARLLRSIWRSQQSRGACDWTPAQWADTWGVKVAAVRSALARLQAEGLVRLESKPHANIPIRVLTERVIRESSEAHPRIIRESSVNHPESIREASAKHEDSRYDARAFSAAQRSPVQRSADAPHAEAFHGDEAGPPSQHAPAADLGRLPGDLFTTAQQAIDHVKARAPEVTKHRRIDATGLTFAVERRSAESGEPPCRWYTALAVIDLSGDRATAAKRLFGVLRQIREGELTSADGIPRSGPAVAAFRAILEAPDDLRDGLIEAHGGTLHQAALAGGERLRDWLRKHEPRGPTFDPNEPFPPELEAVFQSKLVKVPDGPPSRNPASKPPAARS